MKASRLHWFLLVIIAVLGWFGVVAQFVLIIQNRLAGIPETILRYFCYFTVLTNILVSLTVTYQLISSGGKMAAHFRKQSTLAAVAVYIVVVGIVYNIALRGLVELHGLQSAVNEIMHVIVPLLYFIYWLVYAGKEAVQWTNIPAWLRYPFFYLVAVMIIGALLPSRFYPYPFLDAYNHGYPKVAIGSGVVLILFVVLSCGFVAICKAVTKRKSSAGPVS